MLLATFPAANAGDAAILGGLLKDVTAAYGPMKFDVPTINPGFVRRQYPEYDVEPVGMLPWNLSVKIFGLPIIRSIRRSDLVHGDATPSCSTINCLIRCSTIFQLWLWSCRWRRSAEHR